MFHHIKAVFTPEEIRRVLELTRLASFVDGRITNEGHRAKRNLQMAQDDPRNDEPAAVIRQGLARQPEIHAIVLSNRMARATFSRYEAGMEYGDHVDEAVFHSAGMRADVSCTVFLNDPSEYEGGELVARMGDQEMRIKGAAGDVVLYPSTTLHRVEPVTRGVRLVAVSWFQSLVRDADQRDLLYKLQSVLNRPELHETMPDAMVRLSYVKANLLRLWAEL